MAKNLFDPSMFLCLENFVHKKSGCSKIILIFLRDILASFSALLIHDLMQFDALVIFTITSLLIPSKH